MGFKSGFVGVLGQANAGKSSFINALMGKKLLIVSEKRQSTRHRIQCVLTLPGAQIIFVDTPGLHQPVDKLSKYLIKQAYAALDGLDVLVYMTEPWGKLHEYDEKVFEHIKNFSNPIVLLINKIDLASKEQLEETKESVPADWALPRDHPHLVFAWDQSGISRQHDRGAPPRRPKIL
jgi:GTP-binding protein Era